jgi:predicted protein tyrosine phosphatase
MRCADLMTPAHRILPHLYLGNISAAHDLSTLQTWGVTHVVTCLGPCTLYHGEQLHYLPLHLADSAEQPIIHHFDAVHDWIEHAAEQQGKVLVHCAAGVSRSATLVTAYLMRREGLGAAEAMRRVQAQRTCANPNPGFRQQLLAYEADLKARKAAAASGSAGTAGATAAPESASGTGIVDAACDADACSAQDNGGAVATRVNV